MAGKKKKKKLNVIGIKKKNHEKTHIFSFFIIKIFFKKIFNFFFFFQLKFSYYKMGMLPLYKDRDNDSGYHHYVTFSMIFINLSIIINN